MSGDTVHGLVNDNDDFYTRSGNGQRRVCELCETEKLCIEHCEMYTCQECQRTFLPGRSTL